MTQEGNAKTRVRVHQLVKSLGGNILSNSEVTHVFTVNNGLIAAMDLDDQANLAPGPLPLSRTARDWHDSSLTTIKCSGSRPGHASVDLVVLS